jgi:hypothetical protein
MDEIIQVNLTKDEFLFILNAICLTGAYVQRNSDVFAASIESVTETMNKVDLDKIIVQFVTLGDAAFPNNPNW